MAIKKAFTQAQLDWWISKKKPSVGKFDGVMQEGDRFYYTDEHNIKREIIPLEQQEDLIIKKYKEKDYGLSSADKFYSKIANDYCGISRQKVQKTLMKIPSLSAVCASYSCK